MMDFDALILHILKRVNAKSRGDIVGGNAWGYSTELYGCTFSTKTCHYIWCYMDNRLNVGIIKANRT